MIADIVNILQGNPYLYDRHFFQHKKAVAQTTSYAIPKSARATWNSLRSSRRRGVGLTALASLNLVYLYADDVAGYNLYSWLKSEVPLGNGSAELTAAAIVGVATAGVAVALSRTNQTVMTKQPGFEIGTVELAAKQTGRFQRARGQLGKLGASLLIGVPLNTRENRLSDREIYGHALVYGATAAAAYAGVNIGLEALNNPLVPAALLTAFVATRYVGEVCERAANEAKLLAPIEASGQRV